MYSNGQLHASVTLVLGKLLATPIGQKAVWAQDPNLPSAPPSRYFHAESTADQSVTGHYTNWAIVAYKHTCKPCYLHVFSPRRGGQFIGPFWTVTWAGKEWINRLRTHDRSTMCFNDPGYLSLSFPCDCVELERSRQSCGLAALCVAYLTGCRCLRYRARHGCEGILKECVLM
jgi:hypothetical protein